MSIDAEHIHNFVVNDISAPPKPTHPPWDLCPFSRTCMAGKTMHEFQWHLKHAKQQNHGWNRDENDCGQSFSWSIHDFCHAKSFFRSDGAMFELVWPGHMMLQIFFCNITKGHQFNGFVLSHDNTTTHHSPPPMPQK